jgi:hypothetical protein
MRLHVPEDANIVLVEYAVNDLREAYPAFDNPERWVSVQESAWGLPVGGRQEVGAACLQGVVVADWVLYRWAGVKSMHCMWMQSAGLLPGIHPPSTQPT